MDKVYILKDGVTLKDFEQMEDYGYVIEDVTRGVYKIVRQPEDGEAVKFLIERIYCAPGWKEKFYNKNKKYFKKNFGIIYNKDGTLKKNEKLIDFLTSWSIQIDFEDGWIGFAHNDPNNHTVFYGKNIIDKYCPSEAFILMSKGLIEEIEVEEQ